MGWTRVMPKVVAVGKMESDAEGKEGSPEGGKALKAQRLKGKGNRQPTY